MLTHRQTDLSDAWFQLFGTDVPRDPEALERLDRQSVRRAYHLRAQSCHPDRASDLGASEAELTQKFQSLQAAYTFMLEQLESLKSVGSGGAPAGSASSSPGPGARGPVSPPAGAAQGPGYHSDIYYTGPVPNEPLLLGRYLYYSGRISYRSLKRALTWQRSQRPMFGDLARSWNLFGQSELSLLLSERRKSEPIGQAAVRLGLLTPAQRDWIVSRQRYEQQPLGTYLRRLGAVTEQELQEALEDHEAHNAELG